MSPTPLRIDYVSDIACPWCVIGLYGLLQAVARVGAAVQAEIHLQPFQLNPAMPPEGANAGEYVRQLYDTTEEQSAAARRIITERGASVGFAFNYTPQTRIWNTFDAHRLLHWAGLEGKAIALKQALFKSTFTEQKPSNDPEALSEAARQAGLDPARARQILGSREFAAEVGDIEMFWRRSGVKAVPSIIFNGHWMIQGGLPAEEFERAIREVITGAARPAV